MIIMYIYQICLGPEVENSLSHAQPNEEKATSFCCCSISPFIYTAESGECAPNSDDSSTLTQRICNRPKRIISKSGIVQCSTSTLDLSEWFQDRVVIPQEPVCDSRFIFPRILATGRFLGGCGLLKSVVTSLRSRKVAIRHATVFRLASCFSSCKQRQRFGVKCPPGRTSQLVNIKLLSARRYRETWSQSNHWSKNDSYRYYWLFCLQYDIGTV